MISILFEGHEKDIRNTIVIIEKISHLTLGHPVLTDNIICKYLTRQEM